MIVFSFCMFKDRDSKAFGGSTFSNVWRIFSWSLYWAYRGVHPDRSPWNVEYAPDSAEGKIALKPIMGTMAHGFFLVLIGIKGDLDWVWERLKLANYRATTAGPCGLCPSNGTTMPWTDVRMDDACWVPFKYTATAWLAANPNRIDVFRLPGVSVLTFMCDFMHNKHMGVDMYYFGSVLYLLCYEILPSTPSANLVRIMETVKTHSDRLKTFANLKLSMFVNVAEPHAHQPKLKGRAAEIRHFGPCLLQVFEQQMDADNPTHRTVRLGLKHSIRMEDIMNDHPGVLKLPDEDGVAFRKAGYNYLACLKKLERHFSGQDRKLFNVTIKAHYIAHGCDQALWIHPRVGWCYGGEDFMKKCKRLMARCVIGNKMDTASDKFHEHYIRGLHYLLTDTT
jgi:hypothetical protein